jgi:P-type Cu+ transporter
MQVKDPVCGMMVDDQDAPARSTYQGKAYFFCSQDCKDTFDANPSKYTAEAGAGVISS